jgi:hypothetical protein
MLLVQKRKKNHLAFVALITLLGASAFTTAASDAFAQAQYYAKKGGEGNAVGPQGNSLIQWTSTAESTTAVDSEEDIDQNEDEADILEVGTEAEVESEEENGYTMSFRTEDCTFNPTGRNPFFILEPNYQLVLAGGEGTEAAQVTITVMNETREVNGTETRVVEERETIGGQLVEISRNFFAICEETNSVFYFGEEVDDYENGVITSHEGAWLAGGGENRAGVIMPGTIFLGARYYQEIAPNVAVDRAEIIDIGEVIQTPSGDFSDTLITRETNPLEPDAAEFKYYAAEIGLIQEEDLMLQSYGFIE